MSAGTSQPDEPALRGLWSGAIAASLMSPQQGETNKDNTMTTRTARLIGVANLLADNALKMAGLI